MTEKYKGKYRVESTRLRSANYGRNGVYFVTLCTEHKRYYFGHVSEQGIMNLSPIRLYAKQCWEAIPEHFPFVHLSEFVVMPNHIHAVLVFRKMEKELKDLQPGNKFQNQKQNLASIIGSFKGVVTKYADREGFPFQWQTRFYDHIVRDPEECDTIKGYIRNNPRHWAEDDLNVNNNVETPDFGIVETPDSGV